jgi:Putative auto-transporter adhesin, head GIN domain
MRPGLFATAALALVLSGCGHSRAADGGPATNRQYALGAFTKVEVAGPYQVQVRTGAQSGATARGPQAALDELVVEVRGDTLEIHSKNSNTGWNWFTHASGSAGAVAIDVQAPMIEGGAIAGSGKLSVSSVRGPQFHGEVAGSGALELPSVEVEQLYLEVAGSGSAAANGRAANAKYEIAGSGRVKAAGLQSDTASISVAGSGQLAARVLQAASGDIAGSGNVTITGGARCSIEKMGSGSVNCS